MSNPVVDCSGITSMPLPISESNDVDRRRTASKPILLGDDDAQPSFKKSKRHRSKKKSVSVRPKLNRNPYGSLRSLQALYLVVQVINKAMEIYIHPKKPQTYKFLFLGTAFYIPELTGENICGQTYRDTVRLKSVEDNIGGESYSFDDKHDPEFCMDGRHCNGSFNEIRYMFETESCRRFFEDLIFDEIHLDYLFSPSGFIQEKWGPKFFSCTIPHLKEYLTENGSIWLPAFHHVYTSLMSNEENYYPIYNIEIIRNPFESALFAATSIVEDTLENHIDHQSNRTAISYFYDPVYFFKLTKKANGDINLTESDSDSENDSKILKNKDEKLLFKYPFDEVILIYLSVYLSGDFYNYIFKEKRNQVGCKGDQVYVTLGDMKRLRKDCYVNDVIIDLFIKIFLLKMQDNSAQLDLSRVYIFSCLFSTSLLKADNPYEFMNHWTKDVDIFQKDYIIVPFFESCHYSLMIIVCPGHVGEEVTCDLLQPCILSMDSLNLHNSEKYYKLLCKYLFDAKMASGKKRTIKFDETSIPFRNCNDMVR